DGAPRRATLYARASAALPWTAYADAEVRDAANRDEPRVDLDGARARCAERGDADAMYAALDEVGLSYGAAFRVVRALWRGPGEALAQIAIGDEWAGEPLGTLPALIDGALQIVVASASELHLPFANERVRARVTDGGTKAGWIHVRGIASDGDTI